MQTVQITHEPVELFKLLKFEGWAPSGGQAKMLVGQGLVKLNGQIETRKRKKVVAGDVIEFNGESMTIVLA